MPPTVDDQSVNFAGKTRVRKVGSAALTRPPIVAGRSTSHNPPMPATPELVGSGRLRLTLPKGHSAVRRRTDDQRSIDARARIIFAERRSLKRAIMRSRGAHVRDRQEARDRFAQPDPRIGTRGGDPLHALFVSGLRVYPHTHRLLAA